VQLNLNPVAIVGSVAIGLFERLLKEDVDRFKAYHAGGD
jgi:hypothetical protein